MRSFLDAACVSGAFLGAPAAAPGQGEPAASTPAVAIDERHRLQSALVGDALDDARIRFFGHLEGSDTYNPADPPGDVNGLRFFDQRANQVLLNQASLTLERPVPIAPEFDFGFRVSAFAGSDAPYVLNDGISPDTPGPFTPEIQVALTELHADVILPWGRGVRARVGEALSPIGYESVDPAHRPLCSASFQFIFAQPYTQTGIFADVTTDDSWTLTMAAIRGYGFPTTAYGSRPNWLAGAACEPPGSETKAALMVLVGPTTSGNDDVDRILVDFILTHRLDQDVSIAINADYGYENGLAPPPTRPSTTASPRT